MSAQLRIGHNRIESRVVHECQQLLPDVILNRTPLNNAWNNYSNMKMRCPLSLSLYNPHGLSNLRYHNPRGHLNKDMEKTSAWYSNSFSDIQEIHLLSYSPKFVSIHELPLGHSESALSLATKNLQFVTERNFQTVLTKHHFCALSLGSYYMSFPSSQAVRHDKIFLLWP
jgi:hypothetical protein